MASRQVVLGIQRGKKDAVRSSAGAASNNVIVQYERDANQLDVVETLKQIRVTFILHDYVIRGRAC